MKNFGSAELQPSQVPAPVRQLFRQQAVQYAGTRQYGTVILARPVSHLVITAIFLAIALAIVSIFVFFSTTRKAQTQGVLLPTAGVIRVLAGQNGIIREIHVAEGQFVHEGDVLFVLSSERGRKHDDSPEKIIASLLQKRRDSFGAEVVQSGLQSRQRVAATRQKIRDLTSEIERIGDQLSMQRQRVSLVEQAYKRFSDLQATNYISAAQLQDKQGEVLDQRQRLAEIQRNRSAMERELSSAQADARDLEVQAGREVISLQRNVSALDQDLTENEARRVVVVRAQQDGMATAIQTAVGQTVAANTPVASILPAGAELEAEIYAPSRSTGFIRPGMVVLLRFQAYPYQKFGQYRAIVREVANMSLRSDEIAMPGVMQNGNGTEPVYRIRLKLEEQTVLAYGKSLPLKPGMLVDATIVLEHRRLYEWVLEPLFSISGRIWLFNFLYNTPISLI